jgi:hypothetical protein
MATTTLRSEICEKLDRLSCEDQQRVLDLTRSLAENQSSGISGKDLLPFTRGFPKEDIEIMRRAVDEDCEKVDLSEW